MHGKDFSSIFGQLIGGNNYIQCSNFERQTSSIGYDASLTLSSRLVEERLQKNIPQ